MARSTYIYILYDPYAPNAGIAGAFTIKHEVIKFWRDHMQSDPRAWMDRVRDGENFVSARPVEGWQE